MERLISTDLWPNGRQFSKLWPAIFLKKASTFVNDWYLVVFLKIMASRCRNKFVQRLCISFIQAATPEDAEAGMVFMQDMIDLSKQQAAEGMSHTLCFICVIVYFVKMLV